MDQISLGSLIDGIQKVGFPIMVAAGALWVCWKLALRQLDKQEAQIDKMAAAHAEERREVTAGFLAKLAEINTSVRDVGDEVRDLRERLTPAGGNVRLRGG